MQRLIKKVGIFLMIVSIGLLLALPAIQAQQTTPPRSPGRIGQKQNHNLLVELFGMERDVSRKAVESRSAAVKSVGNGFYHCQKKI